MKEITIGEAVRRRRKELGLSQEKLCEGICSTNTLSRIETGVQTPSYNNLIALLERLGMPSDRFYGLLSEQEESVETSRKELHSCVVLFERASGSGRVRARNRVLSVLQELENVADADDKATQQYILCVKAALGTENGPYTPAKRREILMEALRLTVPKFDLNRINSFRYTIEETRLINQIAATYSREGNINQTISIYRQLLKYIQANDQELAQYAAHLTIVTHNYARELGLDGHYDEAVEVAQLGWQTCIKYGHYQFLPGHIAIIAECKYFLGEIEESKNFYYQAHFLYMSIKDRHNQAIIDTEAKERLQITFPY